MVASEALSDLPLGSPLALTPSPITSLPFLKKVRPRLTWGLVHFPLLQIPQSWYILRGHILLGPAPPRPSYLKSQPPPNTRHPSPRLCFL